MSKGRFPANTGRSNRTPNFATIYLAVWISELHELLFNDSSADEKTLKILAFAMFFMLSSPTIAQVATPVGLWQTINDRNGEVESLVRIIEVNGRLEGRVDVVFSPPAPSANPLCEECKGDLKNKPIVGMTILRGLRQDGEEYSGGEILDPDNGKVYQCKIRLMDGGNKLEVRGFIGISLFGRTQTWVRKGN